MFIFRDPLMKKKLEKLYQQVPEYPRTFRLIWNAARGLTIAWGFLLLIQGILPVAIVYLTKSVIDSFVAVRASTGNLLDLQPFVLQVLLMGAILLLSELVQSVLEWVRTAQAEYIGDHITNLIQVKSYTVDLKFYESPEYYNHMHRARSEATSRSLALLESGGGLVQNSITLVSMAVVLIPYSIWLPLILFIGTLPALLVVFRHNTLYHRWWEKTTVMRRWTQYYDFMITTTAAAQEIRIFDLGGHFQSAYNSIRSRLRLERLQLLKRQSIGRFGAGASAFIITGGAVSWMIWRAINGFYSLGDIALFYQAYSKGQGLMRGLLGNVGQIYANSLFLSNLYDFLDLEREIQDPIEPIRAPVTLTQGVDLDGVTFRYPGGSKPVLQDFSITFPAGKITAIVGPNGAGKSTMVKLLCRFYDPEAGKINFDGVDLRQMKIADLRRMITVLFQVPVPYYATAGDNISLGDLATKIEQSQIESAARGAGAHEIISRLQNGYDTMLGKLFDGGTELSVGEWQRIALARAFMRQSPVIILDEPTSSMDPWAEAEWMERFHSLVKGRTSIIITHRFTTAKHADIIYVMNEGKIVEAGSHEELLIQGNLYAQSWLAQTRQASVAVSH